MEERYGRARGEHGEDGSRRSQDDANAREARAILKAMLQDEAAHALAQRVEGRARGGNADDRRGR